MPISEQQIQIPTGDGIKEAPINFLLSLNSRRVSHTPGEATCLQGEKGILVAPRLTSDHSEQRLDALSLSRRLGVLMDYVTLGLEIAAVRSQLSSLNQGDLTLVCHNEACPDNYARLLIDQLKALKSAIIKGVIFAPVAGASLGSCFDPFIVFTPPGFESSVGALGGTALAGKFNYQALLDIQSLLRKLESGSFDMRVESELGAVEELSSSGRYSEALVQLDVADNIPSFNPQNNSVPPEWLPMAELLAVKGLDYDSTRLSRSSDVQAFLASRVKSWFGKILAPDKRVVMA